jgi:hypothetical protein
MQRQWRLQGLGIIRKIQIDHNVGKVRDREIHWIADQRRAWRNRGLRAPTEQERTV